MLLVGSAAVAGVTFHSANSNTAIASATLSITVGSSDVSVGDIFTARVTVAATPTVVPPSGFIQIRCDSNGSAVESCLYYNLTAAPGTYVWTFNVTGTPSSVTSAGDIEAYSGADPVTPVETSSGTSTSLGTSHAAPSLTTATNNEMLVGYFAAAALGTWTPPGGMTERIDLNETGLSIETDDVVQVSAGASGSKTATITIAGPGIAQLLAIQQAPATATPTNTATATPTPTSTASPTSTPIPTSTGTNTGTPTVTPTPTITPTSTRSPTSTITQTPTITNTPTPTPTITNTPVVTPFCQYRALLTDANTIYVTDASVTSTGTDVIVTPDATERIYVRAFVWSTTAATSSALTIGGAAIIPIDTAGAATGAVHLEYPFCGSLGQNLSLVQTTGSGTVRGVLEYQVAP